MRLSRELRLARCVRRCSTKSGNLAGIGTYEAVLPSSEHDAGSNFKAGDMNRYSSVITQRKSQGAGQAQLYATDVGKIENGMKKPQVGISSVWYEGNPCNMHLLDVAGQAKKSLQALGMVGLRFNSIGVSDGISNGTDGMAYSLQSRDLIADGIETVTGCADTYVPVPPYCTYGLQLASTYYSCVLYVPKAYGSLPPAATAARMPHAYQPRAHCMPCRVT